MTKPPHRRSVITEVKRLAYGPEFITKFVNAIAKFTKRGVHVVRIKS